MFSPFNVSLTGPIIHAAEVNELESQKLISPIEDGKRKIVESVTTLEYDGSMSGITVESEAACRQSLR